MILIQKLTEEEQRAKAAEQMREQCLLAVASEPELPGGMPVEMWKDFQSISQDKRAVERFFRHVVKGTKSAISKRISEIE